jgi:hypothetical protein
MRGLSGSPYRFRPVIVGLFFFLMVCCVGSPADAASSCGLSENVCPVCSSGGLALNDSRTFDNNYPDNIVTPLGFAGLTCNYGNPLSGNTVTMAIVCYKDAGIAQKWYQYYRKEIPYPFPETGYGSGYAQDYQDHRVGVQAQIFGKDDRPVPTFKTAYQDWDYSVNGRYEAEIFSLTPTDTITQQEASAINVRRIQQFAGCFASFAPGGVQQATQQVIKGTITGKGYTRELYQEIQEAIDEAYLHGNDETGKALLERIEAGSALARPLRHVKIIWKGSQEAGAQDKEFITATDANGNFEIPAVLESGKQYQFDIEFTYRKAETDYFSISEAGVYNVATYSHVFDYTGAQDLRQDVNIMTEMKKADVGEEYIAGVTSPLYLYDETANAFEFYQDHLKETLDCNLPLSVYPFWPDRRSKFEIDSGRGNGTPSPAIVIKPEDSTFDNPSYSQYIVFHEFSHYAMYCIYGKKFPESAVDKTGPVKTINHGGYMNPSTSDSFTEGFADFMAAVMQDFYGNPQAGTSSGMGGIDDIVRAYEYEGKAEDFAVSTALWNMYNTDQHYVNQRKMEERIRRDRLLNPASIAFEANLRHMTADEYRAQLTREIDLLQSGTNLFDDKHPVKLRFDQVWPVLRTYNSDFTAVYEGFVSRYPGQKAGIDTVFAAHGFFRDVKQGNGSYDPGEPWRPASGNRTTYAAGDPFIDYPNGGFSFYKISDLYTGSETVGSASEYQRTTRRSTEPLPGHFIRTVADVPLYVVSVEYYDQPWKSYRTLVSSENNMVPVPIPPPGENAGVIIVPVGVKSDSPLFFWSEDFNRNFPAAAARGYYIEHDFRVSGPIPPRTTVSAGNGFSLAAFGKERNAGIFAIQGPVLMALELAKSGDIRSLWILLVPAGILAIFLLQKRKQE